MRGIQNVKTKQKACLPTIQHPAFTGQHKEQQHQRAANKDVQVSIESYVVRDGVDQTTDRQDEQDVENVGANDVANRNIGVFLGGGHHRCNQLGKGRTSGHNGQADDFLTDTQGLSHADAVDHDQPPSQNQTGQSEND